jgi:hypothetical protein
MAACNLRRAARTIGVSRLGWCRPLSPRSLLGICCLCDRVHSASGPPPPWRRH